MRIPSHDRVATQLTLGVSGRQCSGLTLASISRLQGILSYGSSDRPAAGLPRHTMQGVDIIEAGARDRVGKYPVVVSIKLVNK